MDFYVSSQDEMLAINERSKSVLDENKLLTMTLESLNEQLNMKDIEVYNLETKIENLNIFEQHLTSLNLRCEFLDKQISHLEQRPKYSINSSMNRDIRDFNESSFMNIERKTTEITLENLRTEFNYLKDQLDLANNQSTADTSTNDMSYSQFSTAKSASIFSENDVSSLDEDAFMNIENNQQRSTFKKIPSYDTTPILVSKHPKKKKLMKMESFLNFSDPNEHNEPKIRKNDSTPLRGFKLHTKDDNPLNENALSKLKNKASVKSIRKKLELVDLPSIEEENYHAYVLNSDLHEISEEYEQETNDEYHNLEISLDQNFLKRHSSLPEIESLSNFSDEPIRHFISYDTGLNNKHKSNYAPHLDSPYGKKNYVESSPLLKYENRFDSEILDEIERKFGLEELNKNLVTPSDLNYYKEMPSDNESNESYGSENVTPVIVRKQSTMTLHKSKSHESIFSSISKVQSIKNVPRFDPRRERNLDIKTQTMKWLKPTHPIVSSSVQASFATATPKILSNAHDDIMNILHGGTNKSAEVPTKPRIESSPIKINANLKDDLGEDENGYESSWMPHSLFSTPITIKKNSLKNPYINENHTSSWFSSLIPNSAYTNPEIGKLVGKQPFKTINENSSNKFDLSPKQSPKVFNSPIHIQKNRNNRLNTYNGSASSLVFERKGKYIVRHGAGSQFNNNVISTRVSHGALREALEFEIGK